MIYCRDVLQGHSVCVWGTAGMFSNDLIHLYGGSAGMFSKDLVYMCGGTAGMFS